ncbi:MULTISPECIES: carboxymuconolactone decarboxylase family protein [Burkholderiaceae]|uniref:Carboxymuconolactone decarboxylase family protein n=1 Tax=Burkholderia cepacia TaxID=292 RepID=A0A8I1DIR6_BURCE|nr:MULTISPECIES: carboxymuconolactone decarboxylase family protein [Burkholderiaceae]MBB0025148.1 carboxymuconolactone decarboxylase family protein [Ralstonia pickettii]MBB0035936.1 carboxymuconolactone decarboxylase family protein [Ralstonia pickettii]MBB0098476.1 carboxymuconolactone decarboxylase family protein [Ralstonia pickettii]MBB0108465.1 carboxymuconolactone decarboxylase family protein [Ralstonia pickettii]MBB0129250.1 carboxymuconolactone decarboxylase family protein [Ralstonia pic
MAYIKTLSAVDHTQAQCDQKALLDTALKQVGFIPNMYANMVNVPGVLSTYLHGYAAFRQKSGFSPTEQEVVFLAISRVNGCNYCTAAHSMIADKMSGVPGDVLQAIRTGQPIPDARLAALFAMTQELVKNLGQPTAARVQEFLDVGFDESHLLNIILAISVKVLSNYSNHAFGTEVDERFAAYRVG